MKKVLLRKVAGLVTKSLIGTKVNMYETKAEFKEATGIEVCASYDKILGYISDPNCEGGPWIFLDANDDFDIIEDDVATKEDLTPTLTRLTMLMKSRSELIGMVNSKSLTIDEAKCDLEDAINSLSSVEAELARYEQLLNPTDTSVSDKDEDVVKPPVNPLESFLTSRGLLEKYNYNVKAHMSICGTYYNLERLTSLDDIWNKHKDGAPSDSIADMFCWGDSEEGYDFWSDVYSDFKEYIINK